MKTDYNFTCDLEGALHYSVTLKWNYNAHTVELSIHSYIYDFLHRFKHAIPPRPDHDPYKWMRHNYGSNQQLTPPSDLPKPLTPPNINKIK